MSEPHPHVNKWNKHHYQISSSWWKQLLGFLPQTQDLLNEMKQSEVISALLMISPSYASLVYNIFYRSLLLCKFLLHYESQILLLGSQHGFQKVDKPKGYFSLLEVIKWGSTACSHSLNCIHAKVLLSSTYTEAGATGLNLPGDLSPVIQTTAAKIRGQFFCYVLFPFVPIPASNSQEKRNSAHHSCRESFLPFPVMRS